MWSPNKISWLILTKLVFSTFSFILFFFAFFSFKILAISFWLRDSIDDGSFSTLLDWSTVLDKLDYGFESFWIKPCLDLKPGIETGFDSVWLWWYRFLIYCSYSCSSCLLVFAVFYFFGIKALLMAFYLYCFHFWNPDSACWSLIYYSVGSYYFLGFRAFYLCFRQYRDIELWAVFPLSRITPFLTIIQILL